METSQSKEELRSIFEQLKNGRDIAAALGISYNKLRYNIVSKRQPQHYRVFEIPKKSGGVRKITAPSNFLKKIQRRLAYILESVYEAKAVVHGFVSKRSVCTNAQSHIRRRFVLNIDLENFFPSINFGRVRGMFLKPPYNCTNEVATILAQICCFNNELPQGAPTSPIVSNMLCSRLDSHLGKLASYYRCSYTRYADDLTFSTDQTIFPSELAKTKYSDGKEQCVHGGKLSAVIEKNGFKINLKKTRLQSYHQRQEVTGIITNQKPNVRRTYIREIRALLHNWRTKGLAHCQQRYEAQFANSRLRIPDSPVPLFKRFVKGKIDYLAMVRGKDDRLFLNFLRQLAALEPGLVDLSFLQKKVESDEGNYIVPTNEGEFEKLLDEHCWVIEVYGVDGNNFVAQGTGFFLQGYGLVTCSHVLGEGKVYIRVISKDGTQQHDARIKARDGFKDVAILDIGFMPEAGLQSSTIHVKRSTLVTVLGFPHHNVGDSGYICGGKVTGFRRDPSSEETLFLISANLYEGNSGGPVLDSTGKVVGFAVRGAPNQKQAQATEFHAVMPIAVIQDLLRK